MDSFIQKALYNLVGTLHITNNKFKELVEDLIQNGHYTEDEGKRIIQQLSADIQMSVEGIQSQMKQKVEELLEKSALPNTEEIKTIFEQVKSQLMSLPFKELKRK
jgi:polyhydroxyalkanoate synthesis regulator phasin